MQLRLYLPKLSQIHVSYYFSDIKTIFEEKVTLVICRLLSPNMPFVKLFRKRLYCFVLKKDVLGHNKLVTEPTRIGSTKQASHLQASVLGSEHLKLIRGTCKRGLITLLKGRVSMFEDLLMMVLQE